MTADRFARTNPFLDELDAIGYVAIPKTGLDDLRAAANLAPGVPPPAREAEIDRSRLYGLEYAEHLYFDIDSCIEAEAWISDDWPQLPNKPDGSFGGIEIPEGFTFNVVEWSTCEPRKHFPDADTVIERVLDGYCENDVTEDACEHAYKHRTDPDIVAAFEAAVSLLAGKINYRMADRELRTIVVTPLPDGNYEYTL